MAEAFGVFAGSGGLVGFLLTVPAKTYSKYKSIRNIINELHRCRSRMRSVDLKLQNWMVIWQWSKVWEQEDVLASQEIYERFWGREGLSEVRRALQAIESERQWVDDFFQNKQVKRLMQRSNGYHGLNDTISEGVKLEGELDGKWKHWIDKIGGWKVTLAHTMYKGEVLDESIGKIDLTIETLHEYTRYQYWMLLDGREDANRSVDPKSLEWTKNVYTGYKSAVKNMKALKMENENENEEWRLVLGKPSPQMTLDRLGDGSDFDLDFVVHASEQYSVRTVTIDPRTGCFERVGCASKCTSATIGPDSIRTTLNSCLSNGILRIQHSARFRSAATRLAISTVLLYGAPWTRGICNCGVFLESGEYAETGLCTFTKPRIANDHCHHPDTDEHRFTRLARALTELCIGETMPYQRFTDLEELGELRVQLLKEVDKRVSRGYKQALQKCLDLARHESHDELIRPERIKRALEEIVRP